MASVYQKALSKSNNGQPVVPADPVVEPDVDRSTVGPPDDDFNREIAEINVLVSRQNQTARVRLTPAIQQLLDLGLCPLPVDLGQKRITIPDWTNQRPHTTDEFFDLSRSPQTNVGILLGSHSGGVVDVDLDSPEARVVADLLMTATGLIYGRQSSPRSHRLYKITGPLPTTAKYLDPVAVVTKDKKTGKEKRTNKVLIELRSTGSQSVVPPSVHPKGEHYEWDEQTEPAEITAADLEREVKLVAAASLLARHWNDSGARQDIAGALAGGLKSLGWSLDRAREFLAAVTATAKDEEDDKREDYLERTYEKMDENPATKTTGWTTLAKLLGANGKAIVEKVKEWLGSDKKTTPKATTPNGRQPVSAELLSLVEGAELFHDRNRVAYISIPVNDHVETLALESRTFEWLLSHCFYKARGVVPSPEAVTDAVKALIGRAQFEGPQLDVFVRVASLGDRIYIDLGDPSWRAIEVDAEGWRIIPRPPVKFIRSSGTLALPEPVRSDTPAGERLLEIRDILNIGDDHNYRMVLGWLLSTFRSTKPFPILVLTGEQGSAKSTLAEGLRSLIDPHSVPHRQPPKDLEQLALAANNNWILALDNLSRISEWFSNSLCGVSTGSGFAARRLYTNGDEFLISVARPIILNGISPEMVSRLDLQDRSIIVEIPAIPLDKRRTASEVNSRLASARPRLLGALLDVVSSGLRHLPDVRLPHLPRMADFAVWVEACSASLGWEPGVFVNEYIGESQEAAVRVLESWSAYPLLEKIASTLTQPKTFLVSDLLKLVHQMVGSVGRRIGDLPNEPRAFGSELRLYAPSLRLAGIDIAFLKKGKRGHRVRIQKIVPTGQPTG